MMQGTPEIRMELPCSLPNEAVVQFHLPPSGPMTPFRPPPGLALPDGRPLCMTSGSLAPSNTGSRGHPELCSRPCVLMAKGVCRNGTACGFCHERHETSAKLDKRQRLVVKNMSALDREELLLPHIYRRLADAGLMARASPLLLLLETQRLEHARRAEHARHADDEHTAVDDQIEENDEASGDGVRSFIGIIPKTGLAQCSGLKQPYPIPSLSWAASEDMLSVPPGRSARKRALDRVFARMSLRGLAAQRKWHLRVTLV